jgi:hypothetical protein
MLAVPSQAGRFVGRETLLGWPTDGDVDMTAVLPPESGVTEWLHAVGLREGWCAVIHPSRGVGLGITFDRDVFHTVWTWGVYGGWRNHYVLLTEPSTSPPGGLAQNVANGNAAWIKPGAILETDVAATVLEAPFSIPATTA